MGVRELTEVGVHTQGIRPERRQRPLLFYDAGEIEAIREAESAGGDLPAAAVPGDRAGHPIPDRNAEGKWLGLYICPADSTG